jgi:hypothetical protein
LALDGQVVMYQLCYLGMASCQGPDVAGTAILVALPETWVYLLTGWLLSGKQELVSRRVPTVT